MQHPQDYPGPGGVLRCERGPVLPPRAAPSLPQGYEWLLATLGPTSLQRRGSRDHCPAAWVYSSRISHELPGLGDRLFFQAGQRKKMEKFRAGRGMGQTRMQEDSRGDIHEAELNGETEEEKGQRRSC